MSEQDRVIEIRQRLEFAVAQLRHAYQHIKSGTVKHWQPFADNLLSPQIATLELDHAWLLARLDALEAEHAEQNRLVGILKRSVLEFMPCPDCRDKVEQGKCERCARQRAEAKVDALEAENAKLQEAMLRLSTKWGQEADNIDQDGDFCCALTRRNDAGELFDELRALLRARLGDRAIPPANGSEVK
jgi:hypothetical protein